MRNDTETDYCDRLPGQHLGRLSLELQASEAAEWQMKICELESELSSLRTLVNHFRDVIAEYHDMATASPASGESPGISPDPAQAHGLTTPATPSAAVSADEPGAGGKPFRLEYGKRYLRRDGKVSGSLRSTSDISSYRKTHPFCDPNNGYSYQLDGSYWLSNSAEPLDLIAEYREPDPSTPADKPRMRQVTLREYVMNGKSYWTTSDAEIGFTDRTVVTEVPE